MHYSIISLIICVDTIEAKQLGCEHYVVFLFLFLSLRVFYFSLLFLWFLFPCTWSCIANFIALEQIEIMYLN